MLFFLDIDGVMVPAKSWKSPELLNDGFPDFSERATRTLRQLLSEGDSVMLTTSHKSRFSIDEWKQIFRRRAISIEKLETLPENATNLNRKEEIVNWFLANNSNAPILILDDDASLNELPVFLKANWIRTSSHIGLTEEHLKTAQSIMSKSQQPPFRR